MGLNKKSLTVLAVCVLAGGILGLYAKPVEANIAYMLKEFVIKPLVRKVANSLENKLVNKVNGVVSNVNGKGAAFITNWRNHTLDSQARGADVFRTLLADSKPCKYVEQNLKLAFGADKYGGQIQSAKVRDASGHVVYENKTNVPGLPSLQAQLNCTLPPNFNVTEFQRDFRNGGWDAWDRLIQPQNNFWGSVAIALNEQQFQMALEAEAARDSAIAGQGFLSQKLGTGTSGIGPTGCVKSSTGPTATSPTCVADCQQGQAVQCSQKYAGRPAIELKACLDDAQAFCDDYCNRGRSSPSSVTRCTFLGKEVTPAQILGKTAANAIDKKLGRIGSALELTDIILSLAASVLDATTSRLANYIGQSTFNRPPSAADAGGFPDTETSPQTFERGTGDPNFDAKQVCINDCMKAAENKCTTQAKTTTCDENNPSASASQCTDGLDDSTYNTCISEERSVCDAQCGSALNPSGSGQ